MNINLTNYKISTNDIFRKTLLKLGMIHRRVGVCGRMNGKIIPKHWETNLRGLGCWQERKRTLQVLFE